jgi:hypothetical protein
MFSLRGLKWLSPKFSFINADKRGKEAKQMMGDADIQIIYNQHLTTFFPHS